MNYPLGYFNAFLPLPSDGGDFKDAPYLIDISKLGDGAFYASFADGNAARVERCDKGADFIGTAESRDPWVIWNVNAMFKSLGCDTVPFTHGEKSAVVMKVTAKYGGAFELYYAAGESSEGCSRVAVYGGDSEFFDVRTPQYLIFEADGELTAKAARFGDGIRLDYTNFVSEGDIFTLEKIAFCRDRAEAEAFIAADKDKPEPRESLQKGFYVCSYEERLRDTAFNTVLERFDTLDKAKALCDENRQYGCRVADETGNVVYTPYPRLVSDMLREGKYITVYARREEFKYGDSCTNPAINHRPHRVSCDRLVDWILYRTGFTDQPLVQGKVMSNLTEWCVKQGFLRIEKTEELRAGDIIFVRPDERGCPAHTFMMASEDRGEASMRYDHGSDKRIMSEQPNIESVGSDYAPFMYAYRPVASAENNIFYNERYKNDVK